MVQEGAAWWIKQVFIIGVSQHSFRVVGRHDSTRWISPEYQLFKFYFEVRTMSGDIRERLFRQPLHKGYVFLSLFTNLNAYVRKRQG